jgi:uncharacterized protein with FMN-binding domain
VTPSDSSRKSSLIALGTTAVIAVYAAGFVKTKAAAAHFADQDTERRRPAPTVHPEIPVAATTTASEPRAEQPAASPPKQPVTPQAPTPNSQKSTSQPVAAAKPIIDSTPVAPAPAATTQVATTPPPDTTPAPAPPKPVAVAPAPVAAPPAKIDSAKTDSSSVKAAWKDGLYFGWGRSRHGDIQAGVEIKAGRIASAFISECLTQYSCSWISQLPPQVVARQSADVDYVSGATQSANAFYYAVMDALKKAK